MRVAVVTFDGFNELDSLIAAHIINRVDVPIVNSVARSRRFTPRHAAASMLSEVAG